MAMAARYDQYEAGRALEGGGYIVFEVPRVPSVDLLTGVQWVGKLGGQAPLTPVSDPQSAYCAYFPQVFPP